MADVPLMNNPMTTSGDVIYGGASGAPTRLAKGSDGQVLTLASGSPSWAAAGTSGVGDHGAAVFNSGNQTITTATITAVTFDSEEYDTDAFHSTVSNTDRLTVPSGQDGLYMVSAEIVYDSAITTGYRDARLYKNGTAGTLLAVQRTTGVSSTTTILTVCRIVKLVATDYVILGAFHTAGSNLAIVAATYGSRFQIQRIA